MLEDLGLAVRSLCRSKSSLYEFEANSSSATLLYMHGLYASYA